MRPRLLYWTLQAAGWGLVCAVNVLMARLFTPLILPRATVVYCLCSLSGLALSHAFRSHLRRQRWLTLPFGQSSWRYATATLALGCFQTLAAAVWFRIFLVPSTFRRLDWVPPALTFWIVMYVLWTALYTNITHLREAQQTERKRLEAEVLAKEARLETLRKQVNPHFLFNSLNSIRALMYEDTGKAGEMIDKLAGLLRYSLQSADTTTVTLGEELEIVHQYLAIEKIRFEERLQVEVDIDESARDAVLPPMLVQTLVENAVKHGIEREAAGGLVRVSALMENGMLRVTVSNPGSLRQTSASTRLGLRNAAQRLALLVGTGAEISIAQHESSVEAVLLVPQEVAIAGADR